MLENISEGDHSIDTHNQHFGAEPFPFVGKGALPERPQYLLYFIQQARLHTLFQPQGNDSHDIGEAVKEGGRNDMFFFIHFLQRFDKGLIEGTDHENGKDSHANGDAAEQGRKIEHGYDGKNEFCQRIDIHKASVEEFPQGFVGFANTVDRGAAMMVLVPFHRQMQYLVIFLLKEVPAEVEGQRTFHNAGGAMEAPLYEFQDDVAKYIDKGIV